MRVAGSSRSRRTPPTAVPATSAAAPTDAASWLATTSALMFNVMPPASAPGRRPPGGAAAIEGVEQHAVNPLDVADQTRSRPPGRPIPETRRGGRRCAPTTPLDPEGRPPGHRPRAAPRPRSTSSASPATTILTTSSDASSVIRRPPTNCGSMPRRRDQLRRRVRPRVRRAGEVRGARLRDLLAATFTAAHRQHVAPELDDDDHSSAPEGFAKRLPRRAASEPSSPPPAPEPSMATDDPRARLSRAAQA